VNARPAIVFGVLLDDPHEDWPGRNQLMRALAGEFDVVYLVRRRTRLPRLPRVRRLREHEFVITGAFRLATSQKLRRARPLLARIDAHLFERAMRELFDAGYVFWLETPQPDLLRHLTPRLTVFDSMDPCLTPELQADFDNRETAAACAADLVFATAASLERRMRRVARTVIRLPNAAWSADLRADQSRERARHTLELDDTTIAAYLGTIDVRVDVGLVYELAKKMPRVQFVLGGRVNHDRAAEMKPVLALENVTVLGPVSNSVGRDLIAAANVCLIPFQLGEIADAINSVKMYTYLSFGKPVVSTDIEECRDNPFVVTARNGSEMVAAIQAALDADDEAQARARREYALANTWEARAEQAAEAIWLALGSRHERA
jgi:glycosyltransferase involved in cell wall biosynthesis